MEDFPTPAWLESSYGAPPIVTLLLPWMTITAALALFTSDPEAGFLKGFGPIETLLPGVTATVIPPASVKHPPAAHRLFVTLMTFPAPKNAARAPATLRTEPLVKRISGPLRVLRRLPLLSENRSPDAWSRGLLRLRMAPLVDVSLLALRATSGATVVILTFFEKRTASFAKVRLLPAEALKMGAVAWNSIVSKVAPA